MANNNLKLKNITLAPYELSLIDWKLITSFERKYIKKYHQKIYDTLRPRLNSDYKYFSSICIQYKLHISSRISYVYACFYISVWNIYMP